MTWAEIEAQLKSLATNPGGDKLQGYWAFTGCQYHKGFQTCAEPNQFGDCPLPRHPLRNGRLNQTAYSLFLFIRDIAGGDIVTWIERAEEIGVEALAITDYCSTWGHAVFAHEFKGSPVKLLCGVQLPVVSILAKDTSHDLVTLIARSSVEAIPLLAQSRHSNRNRECHFGR